MANLTIAGIRSYLLTQLNTLVGTGSGKLMDVKEGRSVAFAGYPAARFYCTGITEVLKDQKDTWRNYKFTIDIIFRLAGDDKQATEQLLEDAMEAVMNAIDTDYTLGGGSPPLDLVGGYRPRAGPTLGSRPDDVADAQRLHGPVLQLIGGIIAPFPSPHAKSPFRRASPGTRSARPAPPRFQLPDDRRRRDHLRLLAKGGGRAGPQAPALPGVIPLP